MKTLVEKNLQKDLSELWQVLNPLTNKWVTLKNQDDAFHKANNKSILEETAKRKGITII